MSGDFDRPPYPYAGWQEDWPQRTEEEREQFWLRRCMAVARDLRSTLRAFHRAGQMDHCPACGQQWNSDDDHRRPA